MHYHFEVAPLRRVCLFSDSDHDAVRVHLSECVRRSALSVFAKGLHHRLPAAEECQEAHPEFS